MIHEVMGAVKIHVVDDACDGKRESMRCMRQWASIWLNMWHGKRGDQG